MAFDTQIFRINLEYKDDLEKNPLNKDFKYKVVYNLNLDEKKPQKKRVITKNLKFDENNQYGNGMTKPLPTGSITFNILLEKVDFEDEIGHLFVVDIMFDLKNATKRLLVSNEIYLPIIKNNNNNIKKKN